MSRILLHRLSTPPLDIREDETSNLVANTLSFTVTTQNTEKKLVLIRNRPCRNAINISNNASSTELIHKCSTTKPSSQKLF